MAWLQRPNVNWAKQVKARDNYKCVICGGVGTSAHHIKYAFYFPELRNDVNNGVTVCKGCHVAAHRGTFIAGSDSKPDKNTAIMYLLARAKSNPVDLSLLERIVDGDIESSARAKQYMKDNHMYRCYNPAPGTVYAPYEIRQKERHVTKWREQIAEHIGAKLDKPKPRQFKNRANPRT